MIQNHHLYKFYEKTIEKFSMESQLLMVLEEMSELQKEILKLMRNPDRETMERIVEEYIDVEIMMEQLEVMLSMLYNNEFYKLHDKYRQDKMNRLRRMVE